MPPWWEDDRGWDADDGWGELPRRRRSRVLQWTGIVVAAALVLGSAGTFLEVVLGGPSHAALPVDGAVFVPPAGAGDRVEVRIEVENPTGSAVVPVCTVAAARGARAVVVADQAALPSLAAGAVERASVPTALPAATVTGSRPEVACRT